MKDAVKLDAGQRQVVGTRTVFSNLDDSERTEPVKATLLVEVRADLERARATDLRQSLDHLVVGCILLVVAREKFAAVQHHTVRLKVIGRSLEFPVLNDVAGRVAVANRVRKRCK